MEIEEIKNRWAESNRNLEACVRLNKVLLQRLNLRQSQYAAHTALSRNCLRADRERYRHRPLGCIRRRSHTRAAVSVAGSRARRLCDCARGCRRPAARGNQVPSITTSRWSSSRRSSSDLRLTRIRTTLWTLLFAPLMWVPLLIVALRGLFGVDVYAAGPAWLVANALFGVAVIPLAIFIAKRYGSRLAGFTPMRATGRCNRRPQPSGGARSSRRTASLRRGRLFGIDRLIRRSLMFEVAVATVSRRSR